MSSFLRSIQRTARLARDKDGKPFVESCRAHFGGRGTTLGTKNPKDPCINPKHKKAPKPWRRANKVDPATIKQPLPRSAFAQPRAIRLTRQEARQRNVAKLLERARKREIIRAKLRASRKA